MTIVRTILLTLPAPGTVVGWLSSARRSSSKEISSSFYTILLWLFFHLIVIFVEEPRLGKKHGKAYEGSCQVVPRSFGNRKKHVEHTEAACVNARLPAAERFFTTFRITMTPSTSLFIATTFLLMCSPLVAQHTQREGEQPFQHNSGGGSDRYESG
jgi:hypothetical protein